MLFVCFVDVFQRTEKVFTKDALKATETSLLENSELYTLWSYRREIIESLLNAEPSEAKALLGGELVLTLRTIQENPKSYWNWHHRRWANIKLGQDADWSRELALCTKLLDMDDRNFHGWGYRRWCVNNAGDVKADELKYTQTKIEQNVENFSAWHARSVLLMKQHGIDGSLPDEIVKQEIDLVSNAIFTSAFTSAGWLYSLWIASVAPAFASEILAVARMLLEEEPKCKGIVCLTITIYFLSMYINVQQEGL